MEGARVPHAPGAFDQHLWLGEIFFSPVHPQSKSVSLMVVRAEFLAAQWPILACHSLSPRALFGGFSGDLYFRGMTNGCTPQTRRWLSRAQILLQRKARRHVIWRRDVEVRFCCSAPYAATSLGSVSVR